MIEALGVGSGAREADDMGGRRFNGQRTGGTLLMTLLAVLAGCGTQTGRGVGSQPAPVVLTFANANHDHAFLQPFAEAVSVATDGTVTIAFEDEVYKGDADAESRIVEDVVSGGFDLGWVAPRPWHDRGVTAFDALMAPFLIDSYPLQAAVLAGDLADEMLAGLDGTGLIGVGIAPGPLRRMASSGVPLDAPGSIAGGVVAVHDSGVARMTFEALGATTVSLSSGGALGSADALEQQLGSILGNGYHRDLAEIAVDLVVWPRPIIIFANEAAFDRLTEQQRAGIRTAADQFASVALTSAQDEDMAAARDLCADGAHLTVVGEDARQAWIAAVQPVYDELATDQTTASALERISDLKSQTVAPAEASACDVAEGSPSAPPPVGSSDVGFPDGTYQATITAAEMETFWEVHNTPPEWREPCPCEFEFTLENGVWTGDDGSTWMPSFFGDRLSLADREGEFTLRWRYDPASEEVSFSVLDGDFLRTHFEPKPFRRVD
jgi:TRAP-type C4-dicarboxylate transport system substrate-binding protein